MMGQARAEIRSFLPNDDWLRLYDPIRFLLVSLVRSGAEGELSETDGALALAASKGDRLAYEKLLRRNYQNIFSLAWRLCGNFHEAQDLTQDLCLSLPRRLAGYRGEASFKSWIYRVVVNAVHDRRRAAGTRQRKNEEWGAWELGREGDAADGRAAQAWLVEALQSLSPDLQETVALTFDDTLTQAEIAGILNISPGTVAWRVSEVKKHLRRYAAQEVGR